MSPVQQLDQEVISFVVTLCFAAVFAVGTIAMCTSGIFSIPRTVVYLLILMMQL